MEYRTINLTNIRENSFIIVNIRMRSWSVWCDRDHRQYVLRILKRYLWQHGRNRCEQNSICVLIISAAFPNTHLFKARLTHMNITLARRVSYADPDIMRHDANLILFIALKPREHERKILIRCFFLVTVFFAKLIVTRLRSNSWLLVMYVPQDWDCHRSHDIPDSLRDATVSGQIRVTFLDQ